MAEVFHNTKDPSPITSELMPNAPVADCYFPDAPKELNASPERIFWVAPPVLNPDEKVKYKNVQLDTYPIPSTSDEDEMPVKIAGEISLPTGHFYWVVQQNDVIHRHLVKRFQHSNPGLVEEYNKNKKSGTLDKFDEESSQIYPKDRVKLKTTIPREYHRATRSTSSRAAKRGDTLITIETSDEDASDSQSDYDLSDEDDFKPSRVQPTRHSTRTAAVGKVNYRDVSASPRKTRSNLRRRNARGTGDHEDTESDDYDDIQHVSEEDQPKPRRAARGRLSRPAYGNIRLIADLSDDDSDDEMISLRAHRKTCERCQKPPAHKLLAKYYTRGKEFKPRKKTQDEDFEDDVNEEQRHFRLGGWVRCLTCCVAVHWGCLSRANHSEIIKAAREKDQEAEAAGLMARKRETVEAYDTTEFMCDACTKGGMCMYCHDVIVRAEPLSQKKAQAEEAGHTSSNVTDAASAKDMLGGEKHTSVTPPVITVNDIDAAVSGLDPSVGLAEQEISPNPAPPSGDASELLFRCKTCRRPAHYVHLPQPQSDVDLTTVELAQYYQTANDWECTDCISYIHQLDKVLAWRPYPLDALDSNEPPGYVPDYKAQLAREYLVKWIGRSYRRLQWVPHMWLASIYPSKLKNFLISGPKVQLMDTAEDTEGGKVQNAVVETETVKESDPSFLIALDNSRDPSAQPSPVEEHGPPLPLPDAESRIPLAWRTIDCVLDVRLWDPAKRKLTQKQKSAVRRRGRRGKRKRVESDDETDMDMNADDAQAKAELVATFERGEEPSAVHMETVNEWEDRTEDTFHSEQTELVVWAYIKWADLPYEESTWDSPPAPSETGYSAFQQALSRFIHSRSVFVPRKSRKEALEFDNRDKALFERRHLLLKSDPELGQEGKLMDFQLSGVNWLFRNWWRHQPSILADEMGLGKTVQIACLIGHLVEEFKAYPVLVVVPNSTITNWLREFKRWAPRLRVVPFNGDAKSREVIRKYELYHKSTPNNFTNLKFHVLVTTYETLIGRDFSSTFKAVPRWEVLIIDEGQRLKNDSSILFRRLNELTTIHRILMTGTPLNNNIRELFNLMNFLDPKEWNDLDALVKKYENLSEELLQELHEALKPYFLRRTKADVLKLPPKNEVIVPVSMTAIQREVYKSLLSQNMEVLGSLAQPSSQVNTAVKKSNLNNLLMQLRKCLQHPYLVSRELEPTGSDLTPQAVHKNLVDASSKLRLLNIMLPKLKEKGHRVLLFSQFVIALDIIEDFLVGEGYKFFRLDGSTKQAQRQKDMDAFNRPGSNIFIYLLSTRAGGVGINLWSADTVIIFDPDFNPHQDLQAISRAHRYGQTKTVLVFKLMVKGAAEERIVQTGKKKLALDHLIVQKMDDEDATDDLKSILTFGAQALFENTETHDINYSEVDIDNLITRTEKEGDNLPEATGSSFGFAKLWVVEKDAMEDIPEDVPGNAKDDGFWGDVIARAAAEKAKAKATEVTGRGAKRRAAVAQNYNYDDASPPKPQTKRRRRNNSGDSDVEYNISDTGSDGGQSRDSRHSIGTNSPMSDDMISRHHKKRTPRNPPLLAESSDLCNAASALETPRSIYKPALATTENQRNCTQDDLDVVRPCGLCKSSHGPGLCFMTQNPLNLVDYRHMLITESTESMEARRLAVQAIDANLASRGLSHLTKRQPYGPAFHGRLELSHKTPTSKLHAKVKRTMSANSSISNKEPEKANTTTIPCVICGGPFHQARSCPVVKAGAESIRQAITRLSVEPAMANTVNILHAFLDSTQSQTVNSSTSNKEAKGVNTVTPRCAICGGSLHLARSCPVVKAGAESIRQAITRLSADPAMANTVNILHAFLNSTQSQPANSSTSNKEAKGVNTVTPRCAICGGPLHLANVCPVVKAGPESIRQAITRLSADPAMANTVNILHAFLNSIYSQPAIGK